MVDDASPSSFTAVEEALQGEDRRSSMGSDPVANEIKRDSCPERGENVVEEEKGRVPG
ncbi:uncharacterized protein HHUB_4126 (plasmid) [Halobacterium hubeiense]|uniref:Uncharacterized protein n=1 Tax=Halobacterium hubeiense TaxID=1407499 RepID=A0A0U5D1K5_9EURY|nr:uncharacterized protein HHUB_4126 [Halobacterium hubeiense]